MNAEINLQLEVDFSFNKARAEATQLKGKFGGLKWTRTIDLPLIRRTL